MNPRPVLNLCRSNVATISAPTAGTTTHNSIVVTGSVEWYKGDATWGVAYKKHSASSWSYKASTSQTINETLTGLSANTKYDIKLYVKYNDEYQYGPEINKTTESAPAENPGT